MIQYSDADCEYSLFISYAFRDDQSNDGWVRALKSAIFQRFGQLPPNVPHKRVHFSGDDIPGGGTIGCELEARVRRSFAMLLVVGKQYLESSWCEKELELFRQCFPDGQRSRLYIAVMGESYLLRAQQGRAWKQVVESDQVWTAMFDEQSRDVPLEHKMEDGSDGFRPAFRRAAFRITDRLVKEIEADWKTSETSHQPEALSPPALTPTAIQSKSLRVVIGPFTDSFDRGESRQPVLRLQQTLEQANVTVSFIQRDYLARYQPATGKPIRSALEAADFLVVPLIDETPLRPDLPGGHAAILAREWAALRKPRSSLVWFRPPPGDVAPEDRPDAEHVEVFERLAPVCPSPQAVVNLLFGAGADDVIRVYIEKHPVVPIYDLSELIERAWASLHAGSGVRVPRLKCVPLLLDQLDDMPKDVAAVVLLDPSGYTPRKSLIVREAEIEKSIPKDSPVYPGLVAVIVLQPPPPVPPRHEWGDVTFVANDKKPPELEVDPGSADWLRAFLAQMWKQHQKSAGTLH